MSEHSTSNGDFSEVPTLHLAGSLPPHYYGLDESRMDNSSLVMDSDSEQMVADESRGYYYEEEGI